MIENMEKEYQELSGRCYGSFDEDLRHSGSFKIGWALEVVNQHEEFLDGLALNLLVQGVRVGKIGYKQLFVVHWLQCV